MKPLTSISLVLFTGLLFFSSFSLAAQTPVLKDSVDEKKSEKVLPDKELLVFVNPNCRPCQIQLSILEKIEESLSSLARVSLVKTTRAEDRSSFYKYGIRGLPTMVVIGNDGKEIHRFTPGIQDEQTILDVLKSK